MSAELLPADLPWRDAVFHAIRAGELLIEAKCRVRHGEWQRWLDTVSFGKVWDSTGAQGTA